MSYVPLCETLTDRHPFNLDRYRRLLAELAEAADAFDKLSCAGHPYLEDLIEQTEDASRAVRLLWNGVHTVEAIERSMLAEEKSEA
ncbi:hypothetical protein [Afipia birgiae]|uniref:hypothetical protein n=1 Tax=Afipia birgiae TaxID=151414 RepID=UPI00031782E7|nr:hypothetical protein [Afipia birgiae]